MPPEIAAPPPPEVTTPGDASGLAGGLSGDLTDAGVVNAASAAGIQAAAPPPTPLHSKIADGIIHAFAGTDGSAGSALRSALAGGLAGLAAASRTNFKPGSAALGGLGVGATAAINQAQQQRQQALENQQKQTAQQQEATRQQYMNAETNARTHAEQVSANKLEQEASDKREASGQAIISAYTAHRAVTGSKLTPEEMLPESGEGGKYDHTTHMFVVDGHTEIPENGKMVTVPTYTVLPRSAEDVKVTPEVANVLKEGGYNYPEGTKINGDLLDSLTTKAMAAQTSASLLEDAANKAKLSKEATDAALQKKSDLTAVNPYLGAHPDDPITALGQLSGQVDPRTKQPTPAAQSAQRLLASYDQKELETHRHNVAEEKNTAEGNAIKKAAGDPEAWNLTGPNGAPVNETGAAYLKTLPQPMAAALTNAAEGRGKPVMMQNRKGQLTPMGEAMMRAYPDYDIGKALEYPKLVTEFTTGATGKSLVNMGTAINHTRAAYDNTGPDSYVPGTKENNRYNQDITFISEELGKYVKGGVAAESEVAAINDGLKSRNPVTRKSALENAAHIIEGRRTELEQQWKNGQVRPSYQPPMPSISPTAEANLQYLKSGGKATTPELPPAAMQQLKEGVHTKFANGQTWMLQGGKPVQVP